MKILIVSHNCISRTSNMGKTLLSYFHGFDIEEMAQLYIHSEEPTDDTLCHRYYRFTDVDALKSIFSGKTSGKEFGKTEIKIHRISGRTDTGLLRSVYQYGERRTAMVYGMRELIWKYSHWNSQPLWDWIGAFAPDVVFLASGDYGFPYRMAAEIANRLGKPLAVCCVDDFYLYNRNADCLLGRFVHRRFLKMVYQTMEQARALFVICESLKRLYEPLFKKPCHVLHTSAPKKETAGKQNKCRIAYLGNLELGREKQLIAIGRALRDLTIPGVNSYLDVYSCEQNRKILKDLTQENGVHFHGAVSAEEVGRIMGESLAVIHTESFAPNIQNIVRHSVSTKIPESLMNGPCIIAYGPAGIASMDYLIENQAAYAITAPEDLHRGLQEILTDAGKREKIVDNARTLAEQNHSIQKVPAQLRARLEEICSEAVKQ